jgi:C-terminal processing protease CtpA/Prc
VEVRRAGGDTATLLLPRKRAYQAMPVPRTGDVVRILDGNIGYADLTRLTVAEVAGMFETLQSTRAIVFDMRGYPQGTAWSIAPRINTKNARDAAMFVRPMVSGGDTLMKTTFLQPIPPTTAWKYTKPTVMLIDERAISQSEHTGLFFEAANDTKFIGTPTAGANGDVTRLTLPGGLIVGFTGHDVRHADGRQLQKVGLTPHVVVAPTIEGIRSGRDEVLEKAVQYLLRP